MSAYCLFLIAETAIIIIIILIIIVIVSKIVSSKSFYLLSTSFPLLKIPFYN